MEFQDLRFEEKKDCLRVHFLKIYSFDIKKQEMAKLGKYQIKEHEIITDSEKKFEFILFKGFQRLKNKLTNKPAIYIHKLSGIPLIGNQAFGLIDRDTSIIEVRIITGCNLDCKYCSVNLGKRETEFVVEKDYLVQEFKKLVKHKKIDQIEAHIGTQGEPLLYEPLAELIKDLSAIPEVSVIALDTNGTLLNKEKVDQLIKAGLTRFCFSINALDPETAQLMANKPYSIDHIKEMLTYISKQEVELIITPVWVPGINDQEIPKLIELSKELNCKIGIQNFLNYKYGKNPVKQMSWEYFIEKMKDLEKKHDIKLLFDFKQDFNIRQTKPLPKPFKKGDTIKAKIVCKGRMPGEMLAVANDRSITIPNCKKGINQEVKLKITRSKHNIFFGTT